MTLTHTVVPPEAAGDPDLQEVQGQMEAQQEEEEELKDKVVQSHQEEKQAGVEKGEKVRSYLYSRKWYKVRSNVCILKGSVVFMQNSTLIIIEWPILVA